MFFWNSCSFDDPTDVGNLISGSSSFYKSSLNMWKFTVHLLLKPGLQNFEHYFASVWDDCNCAVVWAFSGIAFLWDWNENMKTDLFQSCGHCWVFQICWHIECSTFTASSFFGLFIWYDSTKTQIKITYELVNTNCVINIQKEMYMFKVQLFNSVNFQKVVKIFSLIHRIWEPISTCRPVECFLYVSVNLMCSKWYLTFPDH